MIFFFSLQNFLLKWSFVPPSPNWPFLFSLSFLGRKIELLNFTPQEEVTANGKQKGLKGFHLLPGGDIRWAACWGAGHPVHQLKPGSIEQKHFLFHLRDSNAGHFFLAPHAGPPAHFEVTELSPPPPPAGLEPCRTKGGGGSVAKLKPKSVPRPRSKALVPQKNARPNRPSPRPMSGSLSLRPAPSLVQLSSSPARGSPHLLHCCLLRGSALQPAANILTSPRSHRQTEGFFLIVELLTLNPKPLVSPLPSSGRQRVLSQANDRASWLWGLR